MVLVDIYVPVMNESLDFQLDENAKLRKLLPEIVAMLSNRMKSQRDTINDDFHLYFMDEQRLLEKNRSLNSSGVRDGSRLMLV